MSNARNKTDLDVVTEAIHKVKITEEKVIDPQEINKHHRPELQEYSKPRINHSERHTRNGNTNRGNWEQQHTQNNLRMAHNHPDRDHIPTTPFKGIVDNVDPVKRYFFIKPIQLENNISTKIFFHKDSRIQAQQGHRFGDGDIVCVLEYGRTANSIKAKRIEIIA